MGVGSQNTSTLQLAVRLPIFERSHRALGDFFGSQDDSNESALQIARFAFAGTTSIGTD